MGLPDFTRLRTRWTSLKTYTGGAVHTNAGVFFVFKYTGAGEILHTLITVGTLGNILNGGDHSDYTLDGTTIPAYSWNDLFTYLGDNPNNLLTLNYYAPGAVGIQRLNRGLSFYDSYKIEYTKVGLGDLLVSYQVLIGIL